MVDIGLALSTHVHASLNAGARFVHYSIITGTHAQFEAFTAFTHMCMKLMEIELSILPVCTSLACPDCQVWSRKTKSARGHN